MITFDQLETLKAKYTNILSKKQEEIDTISSRLEKAHIEADIFQELQYKGDYFKNNYTALTQQEKDLNDQLQELKKEHENIATVISFISNKIESL